MNSDTTIIKKNEDDNLCDVKPVREPYFKMENVTSAVGRQMRLFHHTGKSQRHTIKRKQKRGLLKYADAVGMKKDVGQMDCVPNAFHG